MYIAICENRVSHIRAFLNHHRYAAGRFPVAGPLRCISRAALRDLRIAALPKPLEDAHLPPKIIYADDVDFISHSLAWLQRLEKCAVSTLAEWLLRVNQEKTKHVQEWRKAKKLGSLLGVDEDIARRKQLATVAFSSTWPLWKRREKVHEALRLGLYNAFILPTRSYNAGTWGASSSANFHCKKLRKIIGVIWPQKPEMMCYIESATHAHYPPPFGRHDEDCSGTCCAYLVMLQHK